MPPLQPSRYAAFSKPRSFALPSRYDRRKGKGKITPQTTVIAEPADQPKPQHCVRCHASFYESNTDDEFATKCTVPHVFRDDPVYLMGGDFTYASECCGEAATVTERGAGTGCFEMGTASGGEPCFVGAHTAAADGVRYNGVNVFRCVPDQAGRCVRDILMAREDEPVFADWGRRGGSESGSEEGHSIESEGSGVQSVHRTRYHRR